MKRRRSILALGLGAAADALVGCSSDAPEPTPVSSAPPFAAAQAPAGLLGALVVPAPAALFELCRDSYDLPVTGSSWAAFTVALLGMPIMASEAFDVGSSIRVALLESTAGAPAVVLALPLRAPDRLIAVATLGESARFRSQKDDALRGERLIPTSGEATHEIGALRNHLVVGPSGALARAGAFLADPEQPAFARNAPQVSGWVHGRVLAWLLRAGLDRLGEKPQALARVMLPEVTALASALEPVTEISFEATLSKTSSSLRLAVPKSEAIGAAFSSLSRGELAPMLATDRDASFSVRLYQPAAERVKAAEHFGKVLSVIGVSSQPAAAMGDALVALARARADGFQLAVERNSVGMLAYGSCDLEDEDAARTALSALTKASGDPQKNSGTTVGVVDTRLTLIGEAVHVFVDREEPAQDAKAEPKKTRLASVLMRVEGGRLALAAGSDAVSALKKALRRRAEQGPASLAELAVVKAIEPALPKTASFYAFCDPARWLGGERLSGDPTRDRSALALAVDVAANEVAVTVALEPAALRALASLLQGTL